MMDLSTQLTPFGRSLLNRRKFLRNTSRGLAGIGLAQLLAEKSIAVSATDSTIRAAHFNPRAKQVLMLFCSGAISQIDTFDYKPLLNTYHDRPLPGSASDFKTFQGENGNINRSPWNFSPRGAVGKWTSDLLPRLGDLVDEFCFIHSLTSKTNTHGPGENFMSTGFTLDGFPSAGAWVSYALGSANENLPAFVAIPDPRGVPQASANNWGAGFLPAAYQGIPFNTRRPIANLRPPAEVTAQTDLATREYLSFLNDTHLAKNPNDSELAARIASYELAARMQLSVPKLTDLSSEPDYILRMYGADDTNEVKAGFARNCILARRLIEHGVRFVQLFNGAYAMGEGVGNWDGHRKLKEQYDIHGEILDQPAAALVQDMKQRGLLEETLFVFCTEFGRMPTFQKGASGRDHNPDGFTVFLSGAGIKSPFSYGATDEFGHRAVENVSTVYDFHATVLHLLGLDHERLTFYHNGIDRRLTDVHGHVLHDVIRS